MTLLEWLQNERQDAADRLRLWTMRLASSPDNAARSCEALCRAAADLGVFSKLIEVLTREDTRVTTVSITDYAANRIEARREPSTCTSAGDRMCDAFELAAWINVYMTIRKGNLS
jgi:hypothetical protein